MAKKYVKELTAEEELNIVPKGWLSVGMPKVRVDVHMKVQTRFFTGRGLTWDLLLETAFFNSWLRCNKSITLGRPG